MLGPFVNALFACVRIGRITGVPYLRAIFGFIFGAMLFFLSEYSEARASQRTDLTGKDSAD